MADKKISELTASTTPLAGTEALPIVQSGTTKKTSVESVLTSVQPSGTANGVVYLNGSKVATSGSELVFDGTNLGIGTSSPIQKLHIGGTGNMYASGGATWYTGGDLYIRAGASGSLRLGANDANNLAILNASGNLGLGVTPSAWSTYKVLQVGNGSLFNGSFGDIDYTIMASNAYTDTVSTYKYIGSNFATAYYQFGGKHAWFTAPSGTAGDPISFTQAMTLDGSGNLNIANGNLVIGTAGKGIDFSADGQAAGMTSELLDDYEEGTWTPVPTRDGGALSATYTSSGTYTKIGRQVFITGIINISAIASQTGSYIVISGLPFNIALNNYQIGGMVTKNNAVTTSVMTKVLAVGSSLYAGTDKNSSFPPDNDTWKTGDFTFSMTYYVA